MQLSTLTAVLLAAAGAAAYDCNPGGYNSEEGIKLPAPGTNVSAGEPFDFAFCSGAYFKTSTVQIQVGFEQADGNLHLLDYNVPESRYQQKLTFKPGQFGTGRLVVYETQRGYYNRFNWFKYSVQLNLKKK